MPQKTPPETVREDIGALVDIHIYHEAVNLISEANKQAVKTHW